MIKESVATIISHFMHSREHEGSVPYLKKGRESVYLSVLINPRAKQSAVRGRHGERLKIAIAAPPVDGAANDALIKFVAELFDLAKSSVTLTHGESSRQKTLEIKGISFMEAHNKLREMGCE